jgi:hypothetical protein
MNRVYIWSVAEPHNFFAAPAMSKNVDAAPAPTLLYSKATRLKRAKVDVRVRAIFSCDFLAVLRSRFIFIRLRFWFKKCYAAPAALAPALSLLYGKPTFWKQTSKVNPSVGALNFV